MSVNENPPESINPWDGDTAGVNDDCSHEWVDIVDGASTEGFGCVACARVWEHTPGTEVLIASANHFAGHILQRLAALEELVSDRYDITFCAACEQWAERSALVDLGPWFACPEHVALAAEGDPQETEPLRRAATFVRNAGLHTDKSLAGRCRWEQMVAASPGLALMLADAEDQRAEVRPVRLPRKAAAALSLPTNPPLVSVAVTIAELVDAGAPISRTTMGYMLSLLDASTRLLRKANNYDALSEAVESELLELALRYDEQFPGIAAELCGEGRSLDMGFDADIAAQALALLSRRTLFQLVETIAAA